MQVHHKEHTDDLDLLLNAIPPRVAEALRRNRDAYSQDLLEIVMDLGRQPEARTQSGEVILGEDEVTADDLQFVASRVGQFNEDNRAGIERTLHRISAIRNRQGRIVGITCRVGRAISGTAAIIRDYVESGKSILLLGRPGVGKTTMLREVARVLADDLKKRVIVVDTSNEIAGDGDIPHPGIGHARRMQVPSPFRQHQTMIEAVENHMPQAIIIDEIGTEDEAAAARTIAERGVQLIATAHGNKLDNLMMNPTLSDLIGGIQSVILGDEEARRRRTQKSVLERKAPPTFDVLVEIQSYSHMVIHEDVARTVDTILRGSVPAPVVRQSNPDGSYVEDRPISVRERERPERPERAARPERPERMDWRESPRTQTPVANMQEPQASWRPDDGAVAAASERRQLTSLYPFGVSRSRLEQGIRTMSLPIRIVDNLDKADVFLTTKAQFRKKAQPLHNAQAAGVPVYVLRNNNPHQIDHALAQIAARDEGVESYERAVEEAEQAISQLLNGEAEDLELTPQGAHLRRVQHQLANRYNIESRSEGTEPNRRVRYSRREAF